MLRYPTFAGGRSAAGRALWCGPFALSVLTGLDFDTCYSKALDVEKRRLRAEARKKGLRPGYWADGLSIIKGMGLAHLQRTAERLGVRFKWTNVRKRDGLTLLTFVRQHTVKGRTYLVNAGDHYMTIRDGILYHSHHACDPRRWLRRPLSFPAPPRTRIGRAGGLST